MVVGGEGRVSELLARDIIESGGQGWRVGRGNKGEKYTRRSLGWGIKCHKENDIGNT